MPFHDTSTQRLTAIGVNPEKIEAVNAVADQLGVAIGTCDLDGLLKAYLNANDELESVLKERVSSKDLLQQPHTNAFLVYGELQDQLYRQTVQGIRACSGGALPAAATPAAAPFPEREAKPKAKRPPSAYNLFIKECAAKPENGGRGLDFKQCAIEWKARKK